MWLSQATTPTSNGESKIVKKNKSSLCKFGSLLVCILFYGHNNFPTFGQAQWKTDQTTIEKINEMIGQLGDNFKSVMTSYFEDLLEVYEGKIQETCITIRGTC